ncbi:fibronectin type III domain-containing protein [Streptomyces sp. NPDC003247]|uniref:fibronectin type III domain-containing protein n=1 Tax=Streptomyces sp. NPDC003247 TaxID=3364677 RepID=UPI0036B7FDA9
MNRMNRMNRPARGVLTRRATAVVLALTGGLVTTATATPAAAATTCASPVYKRQIFSNTTFSGTPKKTACDAAVNENWGTKAPASGVPSNNFGVRWTVTRDFGSGGPFTFTATAQDGIRVYVDGVRKISLWKNVSSTVSKTLNIAIPHGKHTLRIDYVNWTGKANVKFAYAPRTSASVDKVKPLVVTGFSSAYDKTTGKMKLTWAKNKEMDLAGYRVYRNMEYGGWTRLTSTTATSYTDTPPTDGHLYYYEIRAYDKAGNESGGSLDQEVVTVDRTAPAAITRIDGSLLAEGAYTGWDVVEDAASYRVYRATEPGGAFTLVGTTKGSYYVDRTIAERASFYYRVSALDSAGNESAQSAAVKASRGDLTPPPALTGLTATPTEYGFQLTWDPSPATDVDHYTVYRGQLQADGEGESCTSYKAVAWVDDQPDATSFAYTTVPDGETACLVVDVVDDYYNSVFRANGEAAGQVATELDLTPSVPTPAGSPLELSVWAESNGLVWLDWTGLDESSPEAAGGYRVYRWNPETSAYEKLADTAAADRYYDDLTAERGTTHHYWVTAVAADGTESLPAAGAVSTAP